MAKAIPPAVRREIVRLCQSGKSAATVSRMLQLGYPGVAKVWRTYREKGDVAFQLGYHRCGRRPIYDRVVRQAIDDALSNNDQLGAPIIRSRLLASGHFAQVPHERTIQRWWKASGKSKPRGRRPKSPSGYAQQPHHTWQIDGKEKVGLADGQLVSYLSFTDELTCTFLQGVVFPLCSIDSGN